MTSATGSVAAEESYPVEVDAENASAIVTSHDAVLVCTRDAAAAQAVDTACQDLELPVSTILDQGSSAVASGATLAAQVVVTLAGRQEERV